MKYTVFALLMCISWHTTTTEIRDKVPVPLSLSLHGEIAEYAKASLVAMQEAGIISGKCNNMFDPKANATRAEASCMIALLMQ